MCNNDNDSSVLIIPYVYVCVYFIVIQNPSNVHEPASRVDPGFSKEDLWIDWVDL